MEQSPASEDATGPTAPARRTDGPPGPRNTGVVYRLGSRSLKNLTPKLKDMEGQPGLRRPGLSTLEHLREDEAGVAIDLARLNHPLRAFPDDPRARGRPGHVSITPVDESGEVDLARLREWVDSRESDSDHPFTRILLDAVLPGKHRGPR